MNNFNITAPPKQLSAEERIHHLAKDDLILFGKYYLSKDFGKSESPKFHYEIAKELVDNESRKPLALILPRGHGKSSLVKAYILQQFSYVKMGDAPLFFGWAADSLTKSQRNIEYVSRQVEGNPRIIRHFGKMCGRNYGLKWNEKDLVFRNGCTLLSRSNAKSLRGETIGTVMGGAQRYNRIILDDVENEANTKTPNARENLKNVIFNGIMPAVDIQTGRVIFIQTPVDPDSLCQNILDTYYQQKADGTLDTFPWKVISYKATQPTMEGGVLWHSYIPREELDRIKEQFNALGRIGGYYQEYELEAQGGSNTTWDNKSYKHHSYEYTWDEGEQRGYLVGGRVHSRIEVNTYLGCDPATDIVSSQSDDSCLMVVAVDKDNNVYALEYIARQGMRQLGIRDANGNLSGDPGVVDEIFNLYDKYHCESATIEDCAMTRGVWQDLEAEKLRRNRLNMVLWSEKPMGREKSDKIIAGLNTMFTYGKIYYREDMHKLKAQTVGMGPRMTHDDVIETLFFATRHIMPPEDKQTIRKRLDRIVHRKKNWKLM